MFRITAPNPGRLMSFALLACVLVPPLVAQEGWQMHSPFAPLTHLPSPNSYRTGAGRPGPDYWQQQVDYRMEARVVATTRVKGREQEVALFDVLTITEGIEK